MGGAKRLRDCLKILLSLAGMDRGRLADDVDSAERRLAAGLTARLGKRLHNEGGGGVIQATTRPPPRVYLEGSNCAWGHRQRAVVGQLASGVCIVKQLAHVYCGTVMTLLLPRWTSASGTGALKIHPDAKL